MVQWCSAVGRADWRVASWVAGWDVVRVVRSVGQWGRRGRTSVDSLDSLHRQGQQQGVLRECSNTGCL